jgi:hypothetical protein
MAGVEAAVPIDRMLNGSSLSPEKIAQLKQAYESTLRALSLVDRNDPVAEIVARKIIEIGKSGGDAVEISKLAVKEFGFDQQGPDTR